MATITTRTRADGTVGYTVQIRIARDEFKHTEAQTFGRKPTAECGQPNARQSWPSRVRWNAQRPRPLLSVP